MVYLAAALVFLAFLRLDNRLGAQLLDEGIAHIGYCRGAVQASLSLHLAYDMLDGVLFVLVQLQRLLHQAVTFHQLAGGKADREAGCHCVIFYQVHHAVQAAVHRSAVVFLVTEVFARGLLLIAGDVHRVLYQLVDTLVLCCGDGDDRNAQQALHSVYSDASSVSAQLVHHIQGKDDGDVQLH